MTASLVGGMDSREYNDELHRVNDAMQRAYFRGDGDALYTFWKERRTLYQMRDAMLAGRMLMQPTTGNGLLPDADLGSAQERAAKFRRYDE